jgi:hypothetical protein
LWCFARLVGWLVRVVLLSAREKGARCFLRVPWLRVVTAAAGHEITALAFNSDRRDETDYFLKRYFSLHERNFESGSRDVAEIQSLD